MKEIWKKSTRSKFIGGKLKTKQRKVESKSHDGKTLNYIMDSVYYHGLVSS
jgi:hypothetical protein